MGYAKCGLGLGFRDIDIFIENEDVKATLWNRGSIAWNKRLASW